MAEQHAVLMTITDSQRRFRDMLVFSGSWNAAQAVWVDLDSQKGSLVSPVAPEVRSFCVRSLDDPRVKNAVQGDRIYSLNPGSRSLLGLVERYARIAEREYNRKALGEIAREAVADESLVTLAQVQRQVARTAALMGITAARHEVEDAVFSRVTIGRVSTGYSYRDRGRAYFIRKKDGPLHKVRVNGAGMKQTTRLYRGTFARLIKQEDGSFEDTLERAKVTL